MPPSNPTIKLPPSALPVERALLCGCLIDPDAYIRCAGIVRPGAFYDHRHQIIWDSMSNLWSKSAPIDAVAVSEELERAGHLEQVGGDVFLGNLTSETATAAHVESYAEVVQQKSVLRSILTHAGHWIEKVYEEPDPADLIDEAMGSLYTLHTGRSRRGMTTMKKLVDVAMDSYDKIVSRGSGLTGVTTGFPYLDSLTLGWQPGHLIVIGGRPSMGKSAFALDLVRAASHSGAPTAVFSLEMSEPEIASRLIAAEAKISITGIRGGSLQDKDFERWSLAIGRAGNLPIRVTDTRTLGINDIRSECMKLSKRKPGLKMVVIDYLQLLRAANIPSREQQVAQMSRALKIMAGELDVPVIVLSQLSRAVEQRGGNREPNLSDLRDSGAIEQDADEVLFIHRKGYYDRDESKPPDNSAVAIVAKQRNGPIGRVHLRFLDFCATFVPASDEEISGPETRVDPGCSIQEVKEDLPF